MNIYRKINTTTGLFIEDVLLGNIPTMEDGISDPQYIEAPCPDGFYHPKWDGGKWVEGLSQAEIDAIKASSIVPDVDAELASDIQAATTLEELKSALLGKNGIAKVKGRHV